MEGCHGANESQVLMINLVSASGGVSSNTIVSYRLHKDCFSIRRFAKLINRSGKSGGVCKYDLIMQSGLVS